MTSLRRKSLPSGQAPRPSERLADVIGAVRGGGGRARDTGAEFGALLARRGSTFDAFLAEIEAEAQADGPEAEAELAAFRLYFAGVRTTLRFEYFEKSGTLPVMARTTRSIGSATAAAVAPKDMLDVERQALEVLADLDDDAFVEVQIKEPRKTRAVFPVGFLRRYLAAQSVPGRQVLVFDSDEEISSEVAASMLGVSRPYLNELLDVEAIPYRRVGNQRRIRIVDLNAYRERRDHAEAGMHEMADIINESADGWTQ